MTYFSPRRFDKPSTDQEISGKLLAFHFEDVNSKKSLYIFSYPCVRISEEENARTSQDFFSRSKNPLSAEGATLVS